MLLRAMSSNSERAAENGKANGSSATYNSLNSFVVNHQTPLSYAKSQRRGGLPRGKLAGSTGSLAASAQPEAQHHHRLSCDAECLSVAPRSRSVSHEFPPPLDWAALDARAATPPPRPLSDAVARPFTAPPVPDGAARMMEAGLEEQCAQRTVGRHVTLDRRTSAASSEDSADAFGSETGTRGVPVFVMMPLDTVNADGVFRYASSIWFHQALEALASSGVHGIAIDVWWGAVERQPERYDWSGYCQLFELVKSMGLKIQAVLSFHACGGNVGDSAQIPLPKWVLQVGEQDPDIFFTDRPRSSRGGQRNQEYLSFWADEAPRALCGRSPLECYTDFMRSFRACFMNDLGTAIEEVVIGCGPCGELRYAAYPEMNGWRFPGVGEFQCYDRRALASLSQAAVVAGHPEWGETGPHDAGEYNTTPDETGFFCGWGGSWDTPYGHFFLEWYARALLDHGERLLQAASSIFNFRIPRIARQRQHRARENVTDGTNGLTEAKRPAREGSGSSAGQQSLRSEAESELNDRQIGVLPQAEQQLPSSMNPPNTRSVSLSSTQDVGSTPGMDGLLDGDEPSTTRQQEEAGEGLIGWPRLQPSSAPPERKSLSLTSLATDKTSAAVALHSTRSDDGELRSQHPLDAPSGRAVGVTLKVAGVHWWYRTHAHAAELTAGYFNAGERDGYRDIVALCAKYNATLTLTCVEMCDAQHPPEALCSPEGLLRQVKEAAAEAGVEMGGENALPCFSPLHMDAAGLDRIVYNTQAWAPPLQEEAAKEEALYNRHADPGNADAAAVPPLPDAVKLGLLRDSRMVRSGKLLQSHLPVLRGLTFLRLSPEMMTPSYQGVWLKFMHRMQNVVRRPPNLPS